MSQRQSNRSFGSLPQSVTIVTTLSDYRTASGALTYCQYYNQQRAQAQGEEREYVIKREINSRHTQSSTSTRREAKIQIDVMKTIQCVLLLSATKLLGYRTASGALTHCQCQNQQRAQQAQGKECIYIIKITELNKNTRRRVNIV